MRAVVTRGVGDVVVDVVPEPMPGEVLIGVDAVGICGSDVGLVRGTHPYGRYPLVQGHEIAGRVLDGDGSVAAGTAVVVDPVIGCGRCRTCARGLANACPGLEVVGVHRDGGLAERVSVPSGCVVPIDPAVPATVAVMTEPVAVAMRALRRLAAPAGAPVLVIGAGSIGRAVTLVAATEGRPALVLDRDDARLALAASLGAVATARVDDEDALTALALHGILHAVDAVGVPDTLDLACRLVDPGARLVTIGVATTPRALTLAALTRKELTILGSRNSSGDLAAAADLVARHRDALATTVSHVVGLEEAATLLAAPAERRAGVHKIVVVPGMPSACTPSGMMSG